MDVDELSVETPPDVQMKLEPDNCVVETVEGVEVETAEVEVEMVEIHNPLAKIDEYKDNSV